MGRLSRLLRRDPAETATHPAFAFCETVHATPTSPIHIRRVGSEGLKPGGGAPNTVLCGRDLHKGWDLPGRLVTPDSVDRLRAIPTGTPGRLCAECAEDYTTSPL